MGLINLNSARWRFPDGTMKAARDPMARRRSLGWETTDLEIPELTNPEPVELRIRMTALENIVFALLAAATDRQLDLTREMVGYVSPTTDFTPHSFNNKAAAHVINLVRRALQFPDAPASPAPYKRAPVFDEITLPAGLRREHRTKAGVWGVIRVLDGRLRYQVLSILHPRQFLKRVVPVSFVPTSPIWSSL